MSGTAFLGASGDQDFIFNFSPIFDTGEGDPIKFRAFITSLSDTSSGNWNENKDMGRADPRFMYSGYSREISVDFKVAVIGVAEKEIITQSLNSLTALTRPHYKANVGYNGVFCRMAIGNFIDEVGIVNSVAVIVDENGDWDNGVPLVYGVSVNFRVVGILRPEWKETTGNYRSTRIYGTGLGDND